MRTTMGERAGRPVLAWVWPGGLAALMLVAALGCGQNKMMIKVQRVIVPGESETGQLQEQSVYGRAVLTTIGAIQEIEEKLGDFGGRLKKLVELYPRFEKVLMDERLRIKTVQTKCRSHINALMALFEGNAVGASPRIEFQLMKARVFLQTEITPLVRSIEDLAENRDEWIEVRPGAPDEERHKAEVANAQLEATLGEDEVKALTLSLETAAAASIRRTSESLGFGGFATIGVFEINASDPAYRKILPGGRLVPEPFTLVQGAINGDSSLMFVMENPGQMRIYQVQNDPTQLARNIAILIQKATTAANKFMSMMVAP